MKKHFINSKFTASTINKPEMGKVNLKKIRYMFLCNVCVWYANGNALWTFLVPKVAIFKIVKSVARFSSFPSKVCYIWWLFQVLLHAYLALSTLKIPQILQKKFFGENEEKTFLNGHFWNQNCSQCNAIFLWI